jgi:GNAT superfamily N-acetyltransferase
MIDELKINKATSSDIPAILLLHAQLDGEESLSLDEANRIFGKFKQYPNYSLYIAKIKDRIIGTFELLIMDNLAHKGAPSGIVEDVIVDKDHRTLGIGRKMMEYALEVCRKNGCYKLSLSSNINRKQAHAFYEKLGFKKHGYSFIIELIQI